MKAPKKYHPWARGFRWGPPDKEWLEYHYLELRKSAEDIAREVGAGASTVRRWLREAKVPRRTRYAHMLGDTNPNWVDGTYAGRVQHIARNIQYASGVSQTCVWCGQGWKGLASLHVHHKDHDKRNNAPENLQWLCKECHRLETALWHLVKQGKIDLECDGQERTMVIKFK